MKSSLLLGALVVALAAMINVPAHAKNHVPKRICKNIKIDASGPDHWAVLDEIKDGHAELDAKQEALGWEYVPANGMPRVYRPSCERRLNTQPKVREHKCSVLLNYCRKAREERRRPRFPSSKSGIN